MQGYLIVCEHDEALSVAKAESGIEKTIDDYTLSSVLAGTKGRIALLGRGEDGSAITDYLTVLKESFCQKSDICTLLKIAPNRQLLLSLYIAALTRLTDF